MTPGSVSSRILAAALVIVGMGSCTTVLSLDPFQSASDGLCGVLAACDTAVNLGDCRGHIDTTLGKASPAEGDKWLRELSDQGCLDACTSARTCLDRNPICLQGPCQVRSDCCGFSQGRSECERGGCCRAAGQPCRTDDECCLSAGACAHGHCGGTVCRDPGLGCSIDEQCCSQHCQRNDKKCSALICADDGFDCATSEDCCGRFCDATRHCAPQACSQVGQSCATKGDCCDPADVCFVLDGLGVCSADTCLPDEAVCTLDAQCCTAHCDLTYNRCAAACIVDSAACALDGDCCSGTCDGASGKCVPGCSQTDCQVDSDCCSTICIEGTCAQTCADAHCDHLVCDVGGPLGAGCPGSLCIAEVCDADKHCCCEGWDSLCAYEARHPIKASNSACSQLCP